MASTFILRNGTHSDRATTTTSPDSDHRSSVAPQAAARPYLIQRFLLEQANTRTKRIYALCQDYVRPASLIEAQQQGLMLPTLGASMLLRIGFESLRKSRQRGGGPNHYRYGSRGPIVYGFTDLLAYKAQLREGAAVASTVRKTVAEAMFAVSDEEFFSRRGAAIILGVSISVLKRWRTRDVGPRYFQFGHNGPILYKLSDLNEFKAECYVVTGKKEKSDGSAY